MDVSQRIVVRILKKKTKTIPTKQELNEGDGNRCWEGCKIIDARMNQNSHFGNKVIFVINAHFFFMVRCIKNVRYWGSENPHCFEQSRKQNIEEFNLWIRRLNIRTKFLDFSERKFRIVCRLLSHNPDISNFNVTFQQDRAPLDYCAPMKKTWANWMAC